MSMEASNLKKRIGTLGDKQAIHITNSLVQAAFAAPTFAYLDDSALLSRVTDELQAFDRYGELEALRVDPHWADKPFGGRAAGDLARQGLQALAEQPGCNDLVAQALDEFFDAQADFGVLTGAAAVGFVWLILSGKITFKIGSLSYRKEGLSAMAQARLAPAFIRNLGANLRTGPGGGRA